MSSYSVSQIPDEPIVVYALKPTFRFGKDNLEAREELSAVFEQIGEPVFLITDFSEVEMSFVDLVMKLGEETRGEPGSMSDQRIRRNVFIGNNDMVEMAAQSMMQTQYGKVDVMVFRDMETAVEFIQAIKAG